MATVDLIGEPDYPARSPWLTNLPNSIRGQFALDRMFDSMYQSESTNYHSAYCQKNHGIVRDIL